MKAIPCLWSLQCHFQMRSPSLHIFLSWQQSGGIYRITNTDLYFQSFKKLDYILLHCFFSSTYNECYWKNLGLCCFQGNIISWELKEYRLNTTKNLVFSSDPQHKKIHLEALLTSLVMPKEKIAMQENHTFNSKSTTTFQRWNVEARLVILYTVHKQIFRHCKKWI